MYKIIYNKKLNNNSFEMAVEAPMVIDKAMHGQFVLVMCNDDSERIPLTIYDYDKNKGILYLIYQVVGASTLELSKQKDVFNVLANSIAPGIYGHQDIKKANYSDIICFFL